MTKVGFSEFRQRFDAVLSKDLVSICIAKGLELTATFIDKNFTFSILKQGLDEKTPYLVLSDLKPREGNQLAKKRKEVMVRFDFMFKGLLYHARFKTILWDVIEAKDKTETILSTPPLDIKLASELFKGNPTPTHPMRVRLNLFNEEQHIPVKEIDAKGLVLEDRLIADALPVLTKMDSLHINLSLHEEICVPGQFSAGGEKQVLFKFKKMRPEVQKPISAYLEKLHIDHLKAQAELEKEGLKKTKRHTASSYKIMMLTEDDAYIAELEKAFYGRDVRLVQEASVDTFLEILSRQNWDVVLIDGNLPNVDLWSVSRKMNEVLEHRGSNIPHSLLLSEDMSEDALVYAQYCGFEHIYGRNLFLPRAVSNIGEVSGQHDWVTISTGEKAVVIIDDDKNVTFTLQHALNREGYHPFIIRTGNDAVRAAKQYRPICILIEPALRSGDAMEALRVIKRMPYTKDIPVVVLTVSKDPQDIQAMRQLGVTQYLNKPMTTEQIIDIIKDIDSGA